MAATVLAEHLGEDKTGWSGTEHENRGAELRGDLVEAVSGARGGLEEGGIDVREVVDLEDLSGGLWAVSRTI